MREWQRWVVVVLFAAAMGWMEAATVYYLRTLVGRVEPYQANPLPLLAGFQWIEMVREGATMVMLAAAGWLAGRTARSRFGYWMIAFGAWDVCYYLFLAVMGPWPRSVWDWDILFLLPLPWWGPVAAPVSIALLMIAGGTLISLYDRPEQPVWPRRRSWALNATGIGLALFAFTTDALRASGSGPQAVRAVLPTTFNWPLFLAGLLLMAVPLGDVARQVRAGFTRSGGV
jgi:hypothetical protein